MNIMLTFLTAKGQDVHSKEENIYFKTLEMARLKGMELLKEMGAEVFVCRRVIKHGHYRTLGYFNQNNEYLR